MNRMKHASLVLLMLCSMCVIFVVQAGSASAAPHRATTCSGEFCCWANGDTPPACAMNSTQSTADCPTGGLFQPRTGGFCSGSGSNVEDLARRRGKDAGEKNQQRVCPKEGYDDVYCNAWYAGYDSAVREKGGMTIW